MIGHGTRMAKGWAALAAAAGMVLLAACETPAPAGKLPELTFDHLPQIRLPVQRVETVVRYVQPMRAPNVEHLFPAPPLRAMERWAQQRLKADGGAQIARLVIIDASVKETKLPRDTSMRGAFTKQQTERYDARVEAILEIEGGVGTSKGAANANASRWITVREDASLNERERVKFDLIEALMKDFDAEFEKSILLFLRTQSR